ncbi:MAG: hypothetical protein GF364_02305 [Candidatus Lokiarchaeota archaeon]|nr:hypothetical protein [Candidatus Lokiarchaeota archaeon]
MGSPHLIPMIYEFIIFGISLYLITKIGLRFRERKKEVIKYLFLFSLLLGFAIGVAAISRILRLTGIWILEPAPSEKKLELLSITVSLIAFSDIFLAAFILEVFKDGAFKGKNKNYIFIIIALSVVYSVYTIITGIFKEDLTDVIWLLVILLSAPIYVILIKNSFNLAKKLPDTLSQRSMQSLGAGGISILLVFVFFMLDAALGGKYTPFYYVAWILALLSIMFLYIGVIQPEWFKKQVKK